jgi:hypothetical protein
VFDVCVCVCGVVCVRCGVLCVCVVCVVCACVCVCVVCGVCVCGGVVCVVGGVCVCVCVVWCVWCGVCVCVCGVVCACVCVALVIQYSMRMRQLSSVACPVLYFSTLSHKRHNYREKITKDQMCVFISPSNSV